jgi:prophage antirepressor-like protein
MDKLQLFESKFGNVRGLEINGEPWLVGKDVAMALGYSNPQKAIRDHIDSEDKTVNDLFTVNGTRGVLINESGVYSLILSSRLPAAKEFKRWITSEVLPSLRKHGGYIVGQENMDEQELVARAFLVVQRQLEERNKLIAEQTKQIAIMQPKAEFYDMAADSSSLFSMADVAKTLDMGFGRNKMFAKLRNKGILREDNTPYQRYVDAGYFKLVQSQYFIGGNSVVATTTYVKEKGVDFIRKILREDVA